MTKVAYSPYNNKTNSFIEITEECIRRSGAKVFELRFRTIHKAHADIADLNWFESGIDSRSYIKALTKSFIYTSKLVWLRINHVKIIFTFHNKQPHGVYQKKICKSFIRRYLKLSDAVVILSDETTDALKEYDLRDFSKVFKISHPNYQSLCGAYYQALQKHDGPMKIVFFGAIKKYKNIELLIEMASDCEKSGLDIEFSIYGKPQSKEYADELRSLVKSRNVNLNLEFVKDEDLYRIITDSDISIAPYDIESSLNSGSIMLAASLGRNMICPKIGTVKELPSNTIYSYQYKTLEQHREELFRQIKNAYQEYTEDWEKFSNKAHVLYEYVKENNSVEAIAKRYRELFKKLNV